MLPRFSSQIEQNRNIYVFPELLKYGKNNFYTWILYITKYFILVNIF